MQKIRNFVHDLFQKFGWEIHRTSSAELARKNQRELAEIQKWIFTRRYQPKTVLDIGANTGQFAKLIRSVLPTARIISFEPIEECFADLNRNKSITPPFETFQMALGNESGEASINRNAFSPSSSLLPMKELHKEELPKTRNSMKEMIRIERLDDLRATLLIEEPFIVKVDVQGFEEQVILGGKKTIRDANAVVLEVSSYKLYEGAPTFDRINNLMQSLGFIYRGNVDQWRSQLDDRILQFDALFENTRIEETIDQEI